MNFDNPDFDPEKFAADMEKPVPGRCFGILFTPRSGSSWLTDVLERSGALGKPREWFNPTFVPQITRALNVADRDGYLEVLRRRHKAGGFFSFEATIYHVQRFFGSEAAFLERFPPAETSFFYLTREDIVAQAVSLAKTQQTGVFHAAPGSAVDPAGLDGGFDYDAREIARWLDHLADQERRCEAFFRTHEVPVHRITYEGIMADGPTVMVRRMLVALKRRRKAAGVAPLEAGHQKLGTDRNADYAARFRREMAGHVARAEAARSPARAR